MKRGKEEAKRNAAQEAVKHVQDHFVIGLGTGSTAAYAISEIGARIKREQIHVTGVPTSHQSHLLAIMMGIPLTTLDEHPKLDLTIDGADQIDCDLNLIKGGGGALTREKIVASATRQLVIIAEETKLVEKLGTNHAIPLEVLPFALNPVLAQLEKLGGTPHLRMGKQKAGPVVTDNGNFLVDVNFGPLNDPKNLNAQLKLLPGVIETGLFVGIADIIYLGRTDGIKKLSRM